MAKNRIDANAESHIGKRKEPGKKKKYLLGHMLIEVGSKEPC
jgi:hypothetical protein